MNWQVYRPNDGTLIRRTSVVGILLFTAFGSFRWYTWMLDATYWFWPLSDHRLPVVLGKQLNWGLTGAMLLMGLGLLAGYWVCFAHPGASNFLIETENELRKVTWPAFKPWLSSHAEVWGSTYVVISVVVLMSLYLLCVDYFFQLIQKTIFL